MADSKEGSSFFKKVARFVANPNVDWKDLSDSGTSEIQGSEFAKSELKAMIERKRRNDFVRKREFDMLRKIRRQGLTPEQLAALGQVSPEDSGLSNGDTGVRAAEDVVDKIREIEASFERSPVDLPISTPNRTPEFFNAPTQAMSFEVGQAPSKAPAAEVPPLDFEAISVAGQLVDSYDASPARPGQATSDAAPGTAPAEPPLGHLPLRNTPIEVSSDAFANPLVKASTDVVPDDDLVEAVFAFGNADFEGTEQSLLRVIAPNGPRVQHAETWLVLFDYYRATGNQQRFEALAGEYAQRFGWSAPQWFSMPRQVAEAQHEERPERAAAGEAQVGWVCPAQLDSDAVSKLSARSLQMPLPWVFDWSALQSIDPEACNDLLHLFKSWTTQNLEIRWLSGQRLLDVLAETAPTGSRSADPNYWHLRLTALRMAHRPDQFDEVALDYCITYEISPPSWEKSNCRVRLAGEGMSTQGSPLSVLTESPSGFIDSSMLDETGIAAVQAATVELSGQLVGDISPLLTQLTEMLGHAEVVNVNCAKLIRVDFMAAGDLLNWVTARHHEGRSIALNETHRLIAQFFVAMGINENAKVRVRVN